MAARKLLSKKSRFDVFKRDEFTCQYCGAKPPEVILHVDHIVPVAEGGGNEGFAGNRAFKYFCGICWSVIREGWK